MGNITLICKGHEDIITDGNFIICCSVEGGLRRCGGIGDVLAGTVGTFSAWANFPQNQLSNNELPSMMIAAYGGCALTRDATNECFKVRGRSMVAHDIVPFLGPSFVHLFEDL